MNERKDRSREDSPRPDNTKPGAKSGTETGAEQRPRHGPRDSGDLTETDFASDKMGNNQLQGDDQGNVHNERHAVPGVRTEPDDIVEGLEKSDKDVRARRDLGKKSE